MAIPLDKDGNKKKDNLSKSKYHLEDSERKLPRPIVFWSDNEKDAFRRNKVVQTRYYMLLDDIETQQKSSQKTIRHEAQKFRRRYKADIICSSESGSSASTLETASAFQSVPKKVNRVEDVSDSDPESDSGSDNGSWADVPKTGVITNIRKSSVKFSSVPDDDEKLIEQVKKSTALDTNRKSKKLRSQSAVQGRSSKTEQESNDSRSKSAMMKLSCANETKTYKGGKNVQISEKDNTKITKPNSIFFDRSQAAYQLRKELHKLAKVRKNGVVKVAFTMEDAIREEKDKLTASSKKVAEYIQKLEVDQHKMKINEWTTKTIEPVTTS